MNLKRAVLKNFVFDWALCFSLCEVYHFQNLVGLELPIKHAPSREIEKDNLRDLKGQKIRKKSRESFEFKVLKQKQHSTAVAVAVVVS